MMNGWALDKKVPIAVIVALVMQAVGLVVWGANMSARVTYIEATVQARTPLVERFIQTEADVRALRMETNRRLGAIEAKLDRLIERP